jgi:Mrp family chromosome partitioning ATPase
VDTSEPGAANAIVAGPPALASRRQRRQVVDTSEVVVLDGGGDVLIRVPETTASAVRYFLARLDQRGGVPRTLGISAALHGEGTTFVSHAVGAVLANDSRSSVCVVEMSWRDQTESGVGLADVLRSTVDLRQALVPTSDECLQLLPAGSASMSEQPLLTRSATLPAVLDELAAMYDHVILDLPPLLATSDALLLGANADGIALVARHGVTTERQLEEAVDMVQPIRMIGIILNRTSSRVPRRLRRLFANW